MLDGMTDSDDLTVDELDQLVQSVAIDERRHATLAIGPRFRGRRHRPVAG